MAVTAGDEIMDHMPGVLDAVKRAYLDLRDIYEHLSNLAIMALGLALVVSAVGYFLPGAGLGFFGQLFRLVAHIAFGFVIAPYLIAVHRLILLGEATDRYEFAPGDVRLQQFLGWTVVFALLSAAPRVIPRILPFPQILQGMLGLVIAVAVVVVVVRLILILPAVAVDSSRVTWQNAMADTAGYGWRIFLIGIATALPAALAGMVVSMIFVAMGFGVFEFVAILIQGAVAVVMASLLAAIASRLYQSIGDRVRA